MSKHSPRLVDLEAPTPHRRLSVCLRIYHLPLLSPQVPSHRSDVCFVVAVITLTSTNNSLIVLSISALLPIMLPFLSLIPSAFLY